MNLAHVIGDHNFVNQSLSIWHALISWLPVVTGVIVIIITTLAVLRRRYQPELVKIRNN